MWVWAFRERSGLEVTIRESSVLAEVTAGRLEEITKEGALQREGDPENRRERRPWRRRPK